MARPKSKVTLDNAYSILTYFRRIFKDSIELQSFPAFEIRYQAMREFEALPADHVLFQKAALESDKLAYLQALQAWLDKYIVLADWQRCLATLRQRRFTRSEGMKTIRLRSRVYFDVQYYAAKLGVSLEAAIQKAILLACEQLLPQTD